MKLLCLLLFNIWVCGQASSIGRFEDLRGQGLDSLDMEQNQAPVLEGEGLSMNYLQAHENYDSDEYKSDVDNQFLGAEDELLSDWDQILEDGDQTLGDGDQTLGQGEKSLEAGDQSLGTWDQISEAEIQNLGSEDQSLGTWDRNLDGEEQSLGAGDQFLEAGDQSLGTWNQILGVGDQSLGAEDHNLGTWDQILGAGDQNLGAENNAGDQFPGASDQFLDYPGNENQNIWGVPKLYESDDQYRDLTNKEEDTDAEILNSVDNAANKQFDQYLNELALSPEESFLAEQLQEEREDEKAEETDNLLDSDDMDELSNGRGEIPGFAGIISDMDNENNEYENQNHEETLPKDIAQMYADDSRDGDSVSDYSSNEELSDTDKLLAKDHQAFLDFEDTENGVNEENIVYENQNIADTEDTVRDSYQNIQADELTELEDILPDSYQIIQGADSKDLDETVPDDYQSIQNLDRGLGDIEPDSYQINQGADNIDEFSQNYQNLIQVADIAKEINSLPDLPSNIEYTELEPAKNLIFRNNYDRASEDVFEEQDPNILEPKIVEPVLQVKVISFEGDEYVLEEADGEVDNLEIEYGTTGSFRKLVLLSGPLLMVLGMFLLCVACCHIPRRNKNKKKGTALLTTVDYKQMTNEA